MFVHLNLHLFQGLESWTSRSIRKTSKPSLTPTGHHFLATIARWLRILVMPDQGSLFSIPIIDSNTREVFSTMVKVQLGGAAAEIPKTAFT
jgi:hypothetical protein